MPRYNAVSIKYCPVKVLFMEDWILNVYFTLLSWSSI